MFIIILFSFPLLLNLLSFSIATTKHINLTLSMEGNSTKGTCQSHASFSLEPNEKVLNNTQECKSSNTKDNDDKEKDQEEVPHDEKVEVEETGRKRLKRLREEAMEHVKIPEKWGHEQLLKEWNDYTMFDALFAPHRLIVTARDALIAHGRKARSQRLRI
ncbi:protein BIC1-like [Abrus precatorius]|uniref:Protein BIC1-like n=1 Tax=Abrus precatorius TaxID=3816 RepID=A0A8B8KG19_ABRPR|nr:protein BIC1-like [Abrus precatorius]